MKQLRQYWLGLSFKSQTFLVVVASFAVLVLHSLYYYPFLIDDSLITLRYAERFLDGKGLTWNDGERVEGYSNLLWLFLVSLPGALGMDLVTSMRLMSYACMLGVLFSLRYFF